MKILLICEHEKGTDGWSRYTKLLRAYLESHGHSVKSLQLEKALQYMTRPYKPFLLSRQIKRVNRTFQPDVIHFTVEPYALSVAFLPQSIVRKVVLTIHGNYGIRPLRYFLCRRLAKKYYKRIPQFITVSAYTKKKVEEELQKIDIHNFTVRATTVHNGIVIHPYVQKKTSSGQKSILHVGGVKPAKGVLETLNGCIEFRKLSNTSFHLSIIGTLKNSAYVEKVRLYIEQNDLTDQVTLCGQVNEENLSLAYGGADVLLLPSYTTETSFEGFGFVYIEANAHGVPVIGPNTSGAAEAISECESGFQVDVHNAKQIAERLHWILDKGRIKTQNCRKWAEKHGMDLAGSQVEDIYDRILLGSAEHTKGCL